MLEIYPDFYDHFRCLAGDCRHSCCRGWEIDVDAESAERYRSMKGDLGEALRAALRGSEDEYFFRLTEDERCPFLRPDGLCRLILEAGENLLCDICTLHPRFFAEVEDAELCGLGLSCEAVCALLLSAPELRFVSSAGEDLSLAGLLTRLGVRLPEARLRYRPNTELEHLRELLRRYGVCEPIDAAWTAELEALRAALPEAVERAGRRTTAYDAAAYDRIYGYILFRQLERLPEFGVEPLLDFARDACDFIFLSETLWGDLPERLRRWSEEIEYSTENVELLLHGNQFSEKIGVGEQSR